MPILPRQSGARRSRSLRRAAVALAAGAVVASAGWVVAPARADLSQFEARASADGVRVGVLAPGASLFDQLADAGAPVAQSVLTGLGTSQAFASMPYPGDIVVSGPATAAALLGTPAPPPYPLIVQTSHPNTPEASVSQPGYELEAASDDTSSTASAMTGGSTGDSGVATTRARASSTLDGDALVARAASVTELVTAGGVLRIGQVSASAEATRTQSGELVRRSDFHVDGLAVADVSLGIGPEGLVLAGSGTPLPDDSALAEILEQAGVSVAYLEPVEDETGIVSAGLRITQVQEANGTKVTVTYTLGRASAHAGATADDAVPPAPEVAAGSISAPMVGADVAVAGDEVAPSSALTPAIGATPAPAPASVTRRAVLAQSAPLGSRSSIYLVLVLAAALAAGATQLFRVLGVRLAWRF